MGFEDQFFLKRYNNLIYSIIAAIATIALALVFKSWLMLPLGGVFVGLFAWQFIVTNKRFKNGEYIIVGCECVGSQLTPLAFGTASSKIFKFKTVNEIDGFEDVLKFDKTEFFDIQIALANSKQYMKKGSPVKPGDQCVMVFSKKDNEDISLDNTHMMFYSVLKEDTSSDKEDDI